MALSPMGSGPRVPANRKQRRLDAKQRRANAKLVFEALEPRVLLSADPLSVTLGGDAAHPLAHDVIIQEVTQTLSSADHTTVQMIQVVEQGRSPVVLASAAAASVSSIHITSGTGDTKLTVNATSFGNTVLPPVAFTGGNGHNTLAVSSGRETDWDIKGANSGVVSGSAAITFIGVGNLTGGTNNKDVFTVEQKGALSGKLDGGPGGFDSLVYHNYNATNAIFTATGPQSGTVALDGSMFTYAGLEPILFSGNAANITITGTGQLALGDTGVAGQAEVKSLNNSMESVTFTDPTASLTVNMVGGTDSLAISTSHLSGASLTASGVGADSITVNPGTYVSTRATTGDALNAPSFGKSGDLSLSAQTITLGAGSFLYANANNGFTAGNISLHAASTGAADQPAAASVAVHGAQVVGGIITIDSSANAAATISQQTLATLNLNATATTQVDGTSFIASTVGDVDIGASVNVTGKVTASAAQLGGLNADAAVALAHVNATATATVAGTSLLGAIDTFSVHSTNTTTVTTLADGAAGGASAVGGSVALSDVTTSSRALLGTDVHVFANRLVLGADSTTTVSTTATATAGGATANGAQGQGALGGGKAATPDGNVTVAAAIAGTTLSDAASAIMSAAGVGTTQGLDVEAGASRVVATLADASDVQGGPGVGAAVALNAISASSTAELAGPSGIAGDVTIGVGQLRTPDAFGAVALSGAGGSTSVGVAGALAVNGVSDSAFGGIAAGADVTMLSGSLTVTVNQTGDAITDAFAFLKGASSVQGTGASVAIAPVHFSATAGVQANAHLHVGDAASPIERDASFSVNASRTINTVADGGTAGGTATAAALALTVARDDASAELDTGALVVVQGNLGATAHQTSSAQTTASAKSGARATVVGFDIEIDNTQATSSAELHARGNVTLTANGTTNDTTLATGGPRGVTGNGPAAAAMIAAELGFLGNPAGVALPTPATADGAFGVAAAMALGVAIGNMSATVEAAKNAPYSIAAKQISLNALGHTAATTRADASAMISAKDGGGIGAALALQTGQANVLAEDDAPISANVISLSASAPGGDIPLHVGDYTVQAISGAGAAGVGVAGAMAIGDDGIKVRALLNGAANAVGSVSLTANGRSVSDVDATADSAGKLLGVGASFALDVTDATVTAAIEDGGSVTGMPVLTMTATGGQNATTTAEGGALGGTATGAAFSLAVVTDEISAAMTTKALAQAGRTVMHATGDSTATTTATGDAASQTTAIGPSLSLGILIDDVAASVAGRLTANGAVDMTAIGTTTQHTSANAGARGAALGGFGAGLLLGNQLAFLNDPGGVVAPTLATADGALGVAAALSFGVDDAATEAMITGRVGATGPLTMTATGGTTGDSTATGAAVDTGLNGTGIAAAAGVMIATPTVRARIDGTAIAPDATLTAGTITPTGHAISSHAVSGVGGNDTGVAGAFALTIAHPVTEAAIGGTGRLDDAGGDAVLSASGASGISATAAAANLGSGKFGLGASVALDIAADDTHARLEQGANAVHVHDLTLTANGDVDSAAHAMAGSQAGGVAGAVAVNVAPQHTRAEIDPGAALTVTGDMLLQATQSQHSIANAIGGASGRGGGFGAAIAVNAPVASTGALLDRGATVNGNIQVLANSTASAQAVATAGDHGGPSGNTADQEVARWLGAAGTDGSVVPPVVPSIANATTNGAQQLGLSLPGIGSAAALAVDAAFGSASAGIAGGNAVAAGGNITVRAQGSSQADADADASAMTLLGAAGFGFSVDYDAQALDASLGANTPVSAMGITVEAMVPRDETQSASAVARAGAGALAGAAGAFALNLVSNSTDARIADTSPIMAPNFIIVHAFGDTDASARAGYLAGGIVAGTGVSLAANLVVDHTEASVVAGARMDSNGSINISAEGTQSLHSRSAGGALAGLAAVPASLTADVMLATTAASIGKGARIDLNTPFATATQNVTVQAKDISLLDAAAGSLDLGLLAGLGAAAQFSDLVKQTTADIDGLIRSAGDVVVDAESSEIGLTAADTGSLAGTVAVAGGAGVQMEQLLTHAAIDGDATVHAIGDVVVTALDKTEMDVVAGGFDASLAATAGAGIGAIALKKTTEALVEDKAVVDADGQGAGSQAANGFTISFVPDNPKPGEVGHPFLPNALKDIFSILLNNPLHNLLSPVGSIPTDDFASNERIATPHLVTVHGLAVSALSHDDLAIDTMGLGAAGLASLELSADGIVAQSTTRADIGAGAQINQKGYAASAAQAVLVTATGDAQAMAIAGTLPIGGLAAVGPAANLIDMAPITEAFIGAGAKVSAQDGITVTATGETDLLTDATGVVVSAIGVAGSAGAVVLGGHTYAYIDANAVVTAGGSVSVLAHDTSLTQNVAGALNVSGMIAAGGTASLSIVAKDTEAWIGAGAHVTSLGSPGEAVLALDATPSDPAGLNTITGVSVLAVSSELIMNLVANGSASGTLEFIGSAGGEIMGNTTAAFIGDGAVVRAGLFDAKGQSVAGAPAKTVSVGALDMAHTFDGIAAVVEGTIALSGAVDAGVVRNQTAASVGQGVVIRATGDIDVAAHSLETIDSFVGGFGASNNGVELNISASVYSIGAVVPGDLLDPLQVVGGPGNLEGYLDGLLQGMVSQAGNGIVGVLNKYAAAVGGQQAAATQLAGLTPANPVTAAFSNVVASRPGTTAHVDDATLTAFGKVMVTAADNVTPDLDTSFTFSKTFGGGGNQNYDLALDGGLLAGRANATASVTGGSRVTATGDIDVLATASTTQNVNSTFAFNSSTGNSAALVDDSRLTAGGAISVSAEMDGSNKYSGILPGISGLKLRTSYNHEVNSTTATVNGQSTLQANKSVTVSAVSNASDNVKADGATLFDKGFMDTFSLGVALAWNDLANTTAATIDNSTVFADTTSVTSTATIDDFALGFGAADGANNQVAIGGSAARNILNDTVSASINASQVTALHGISVQATDSIHLLSISGAAVGRDNFGIGGAASINTANDLVTADVNDSTLTADAGAINVLALGHASMSALAAGFAQGKNFAAGAGLPVDNLGMTIKAKVEGASTLFASDDIMVHATGNGLIRTLAGGVAIATNQVGAGAAVSVNNTTETVEAGISDSHVTANGSIDVAALSDPEIQALALGFAYAPTVAIGGSVSINNIDDTVKAYVDDKGGNSVLRAGGQIGVSATDAPNIEVLTGGIAVSSGEVSIAASISKNFIDDEVDVWVSGAKLTATAGPIIIQGVANPDILAIAIGGGGAKTFSGDAAVADNEINSTNNVTIGEDTAVLTAPVVSVTGADTSTIEALAFGVAVASTASLAGANAINNIGGGMIVQLDGNGRIVASTAIVGASNTAGVKVITGAASSAGTASGGEAVSVNNINDSATAEIVGGRIDAQTVKLTGNQSGHVQALAAIGSGAGTVDADAAVTTNNIYDAANTIVTLGAQINTGKNGSFTDTASNGGEIDSLAGAASGAPTVAINAAVANNNISEQDGIPGGAMAEVQGSTLTGGGASIAATDTDVIHTIAISGGGSSTVALGGSVAKSHGHARANATVFDNTETLSGGLAISATSNGEIKAAVANAEGSGTVSGGAAVAVNTLEHDVNADLSGGTATVGSLSVKANSAGEIQALAATGGGAGTVSGVFSDTENIISGNVAAQITNAANVNATGAVAVSATDSGTAKSLSGSATGAGTAGLAGAHAHSRIGDVASDKRTSEPGDPTPAPAATTATIDTASKVSANTLHIDATFTGDIETIAIAGAGAGTAALAGSITDNLIGDQVTAGVIGKGSLATTKGDVTINATNNAIIHAFAGGAAGAGTVAGGAAVAINKLRNGADAVIDQATVQSTGGAVKATATGGGEIKSAAAAGGLASTVGISAAVSVNDLRDKITAEARNGADVIGGAGIGLHANDGGTIDDLAASLAISGGFSGSGAVATNDIANDVTARDVDADLHALGGSVAITTSESASITGGSDAASGGEVGVSASVSVNKIDNDLKAYIDNDTVRSVNGIFVQSIDSSTIISESGQISAGLVGIGGAAAYNEIENTVVAKIIDGANIVANGDVMVQTLEGAKITTVSAGLAAGLGGVGGSVSVSIIANTVESLIRNASVDAGGNVGVIADDRDHLDVWGGQISAGAAGIGASVAVLTLESTVTAAVETSTVVAEGKTPPLITPDINVRDGSLITGTASGLVVDARDQEAADVKAVTVGAGAVGVAATVADVHTATVTDAHITGSQINHPNQPGNGVLVHAAQATDVTGYIGNVAAGIAGIGAAVQITTIENTTRAYIADKRNGSEQPGVATGVYANNITVSTATHEHANVNAAGIAAGFVGVGGSVTYTHIKSLNDAYVRDALLNAKNGSASITVAALDNASIETVTANIAAGFVGAGASVDASTIDNTTLADLIGATLNANGAITVRADSTESLDDKVAGGTGGFVAVGGAILVDHIESDTEARVLPDSAGHGTLINQDPSFGGTPRDGGNSQTVNIEASDDAAVSDVTGQVSAGFVAIGAAIHVGGISNHVSAEIGSGAKVNAAGDIDVSSTTTRELNSIVFAGAGAAVALSGAFAVLRMGGDFDSSSVDEVNKGDGGNSQKLSDQVNHNIGGVDITSQFSSKDSSVAQDAKAKLNAQPTPSVGDPLGNPGNVAGTFALVDNQGPAGAPMLHAGGNIKVTASNAFAATVTGGAVSGGLVSLGAGVALVNVTDKVHAVIGGDAVVYAGRDIDISATDSMSQPSDVTAFAGAGGLAAIGGAVSHTNLHLDVLARSGADVNVQHALGVNIKASEQADLKTKGLGVSVGAIAAGGVESQSNIDGSVAASVGNGAHLGTSTAIGSLIIAAQTNDTAKTNTTAGAGGIVAGEVNVAHTDVSPTLSATLGDGTVSNVANDVSITTASKGTAGAQAEGVDAGGVAIGVSIAKAEFTPAGTASIGQGAQLTVGGDVTIRATHLTGDVVKALAVSSGGAAIDGNGAEADATDSGSATASVGNNTTIAATGTVKVWSTVENNAKADTNTVSIGLVAVGGQVSTPVANGKAISSLGSAVNVSSYALQVEAVASATAVANSDAAAGGLVSGTGAGANPEASPDAEATIGDHDVVTTKANTDVIAIANGYATGDAEGTDVSAFGSAGASSVDATGAPVASALIDHDSMVQAGGGVHVFAEQPQDALFANGKFNAATDVALGANTVQMGAPTLLQTGDQVVYRTNGGTAISGLQDGRTYSVLTTLTAPNAIALGQQFSAAQVDTATSTIVFNKPSGFQTGDRVIYHANGGPAIGGLVDGATYFVRVLGPTTIKLATSLGGAISGGKAFNPALISANGLISLNNNGFVNGEAVTYRTTGNSVAGLTNGVTYFVQKVNNNQFRLSALPGGPALQLGQGAVSGIQTLGDEGVALDNAGDSGLHSLTFDLTSAGTGTQQFVGAGGAAAVLPAPLGQLTYTGTAQASAGAAFYGDAGATVIVTVTGITLATVGANASVHSLDDATVDAFAVRGSYVGANGTSGGLIAPGGSYGTTIDGETTTAEIMPGASLTSGQDARVTAGNQIDANGGSSASGGGAATTGQANTTISLNPSTNVLVDQGASVNALRDMRLATIEVIHGNIADSAGGGGVGASDHADGTFNVAQVNNAPLRVKVGDGVNLSAGRDISAEADYFSLTLSIDNHASDSGVYAHPTTTAAINATALTEVDFGANDQVSATHQVTMLSHLDDVELKAKTTTNKIGIGKQEPISIIVGTLEAEVTVDQGTTITTHGLEVDALGGFPTVSAQSYEDQDPQPDMIIESVSPGRHIAFNGNAVLESGPSPYLVVNRFGQIVDHDGVNAQIIGGGILVHDITNTSPGWVHFLTDPGGAVITPGPALPPASAIAGDQGSFTFVDTFQSVRLQNYSALNFVISNVDPVDRTPGAKVQIDVDDTLQFSFSVANVFEPTSMLIGNYSAWNRGDLALQGDIENPIGTIVLTSVAGNIVALGNSEMVRGADVTLQAGLSIGKAAQWLAVEVVDSPQSASFGLNAFAAGGDVDLTVRARLRDASAFIFNPQLSGVVAGGDINLDLPPAVRDNSVLGPDYSTTVNTSLPTYGGFSQSDVVENHWKSDVGGPRPLPEGIFGLGSTPIDVTYTINLLQAGGNINVIDPDGATIGLDANVTLKNAGKSISAALSGDIDLTAATGDLRVGSVTSTHGAVSLTAQAGSILDASTGNGVPLPAIKGSDIALTAIQGSIGTLQNALDIQLTGGSQGLTALAREGINILDVSGDLLLSSIDAGGDIILGTWAGSMKLAANAATPTVVGQNITLNAKAGGIATQASPLTAHATAANGLKVTTSGQAYVTQVPDNNLVEAGLGWSLGDGGTTTGKVKWGTQI